MENPMILTLIVTVIGLVSALGLYGRVKDLEKRNKRLRAENFHLKGVVARMHAENFDRFMNGPQANGRSKP